MTITDIVIKKLTAKPEEIEDSLKCVPLMQQLLRVQVDAADVEPLLQHLSAIISKETVLQPANCIPPNQTVLNLAFRVYYQLIDRQQLSDRHFQGITTTGTDLTYNNEIAFQMLYAILQTEHGKKLNCTHLKDICLQALTEASEQNANSILAIAKALNLLTKKFPSLVYAVKLEHIYHCMQSEQQGVREETLVLFNHCCKAPATAFTYFQVIATFWPWTNRNKYYLLSAILNKHKLSAFLNAAELSKTEFFAGLRSSLSYKSLLAASQYLITALSKQQSAELLEMAVDIFTTGTLPELQNFYSQWYGRIAQKDELFNIMKTKSEIICLLHDAASSHDKVQHFRLILIFGMFSKQIFELSKLHFFKLSTELITNCFQYATDAQLLIFRFVIDNLSSFAIEDCLDFLLTFMQTHVAIDSAQFRNTMLGKLPNIINYIAKYFSKMHAAESSSLQDSVVNFFKKLQQLVVTNIGSVVYQRKIFTLKLLEILLRSLYAKAVERNAKNCCTAHNQLLGKFLMDLQVFDGKDMYVRLIKLLDDPQGCDDALALTVQLLALLSEHASMESYDLTRSFCMRSDVDECILSAQYAKVAMHYHAPNAEAPLALFNFCLSSLRESLAAFQADPLQQCSNESQLFGHICVLNELVQSKPTLVSEHFANILDMLKTIADAVLSMLNLWNARHKQSYSAANFQDMDESLELLVTQSAVNSDDHVASRKFLLMSFWYTLKAACELAATISSMLLDTDQINAAQYAQLEQCINLNVAVLTRCRHKGAIEAAGLCIGKITKSITAQNSADGKPHELLTKCLELLFDNDKQHVSTTRRGAGFSIMLLHIIKNEAQRRRPLLKVAMKHIMDKLSASQSMATPASAAENVDRIETLVLHYLCVLVKDTELREAMLAYQNDIMLAAIAHIDDTDWTICNAALQLFGALVPKIIGQRQATEFDVPKDWATTELTYDEILCKLPHICEHILTYCAKRSKESTSTRSIILFVGFLANVEYMRKTSEESVNNQVCAYRELMWSLLAHPCENVRKLAAVAFVRLHEFQVELPNLLLAVAKIMFSTNNENFFEGLILVLYNGLLKLETEAIHTLAANTYNSFLINLSKEIINNFKVTSYKPYTLFKLLELLIKLDLHNNPAVVDKVSQVVIPANGLGSDLCMEKMALFKNLA